MVANMVIDLRVSADVMTVQSAYPFWIRAPVLPCRVFQMSTLEGSCVVKASSTELVFMHVCISAYACRHSCIHAFMHSCIPAFTHSRIHAFMHNFIHVRIFIYVDVA